jgi:hypothetical protein
VEEIVKVSLSARQYRHSRHVFTRAPSIPAAIGQQASANWSRHFRSAGGKKKAAKVANVDGARWDNLGTMRPQEALSYLKGGLPKNKSSELRIVNGPSF